MLWRFGWIGFVLVACAGDKDEGTTPKETGDTGETETSGVFSAFTVEAGAIPGVMLAHTETAEEGTVRIEYGLTDALGTATPESPAGSTHDVTVLGVKTGREYTFQAVLTTANGEQRSQLVKAFVTAADVSVPTFSVGVEVQPELACTTDGFLLVSYIGNNNSGAVLVDRDGDIVWSLPFSQTNVQLARVRPGLDGASITYTTADGARIEQVGEIVRQPLDGSAPIVTSTDTSHHDYVQLPDGSYGWLGYAFGSYTCLEGQTIDDVAVDTIMESAEGASFAEATTVFDTFVDYPHTLTCDIDDENFLPSYTDLTHANSLMYRPSDDAYFVMWRWHDALFKVDGATGEFLWQLGGANNDFAPAPGQDPEEIFNHSHMSEIWDGGMMVFNNNDFGPDAPGPSIVQEYALDEEAMTWEVVWSWESDKGFEALLGDARRMPVAGCDNVLVSLSRSGIVREITRDGEVAWGVGYSLGSVTSRVHFVPDIYDLTTALAEP